MDLSVSSTSSGSPESPTSSESDSPIISKTKHVAKEALAIDLYTSPKRRSAPAFMPNTPCARKKTVLKELPFPNLQRSVVNNTFNDVDVLYNDFIYCYQTPKGIVLPLIKQPPQKYSCGPGALMNAFLGMVANSIPPEYLMGTVEPLIKDEKFSHWYVRAQRQNGEELARQLNFLLKDSYSEAISCNFSTSSSDKNAVLVSSAQEVIDWLKFCSSILVGIDHPELEGHWIVVDEFDEQTGLFYVRDSYSGNAYAIPLEKYLFIEDLSVHTVFFQKKPDPAAK